MNFKLKFTLEAQQQLAALEANPTMKQHCKAAKKALALMETNLRHPSLHTHKYESLTHQFNEEIFEAYAESKTPAAYRIFWKYGPGKRELTVISIVPHP